MEWRDLGKAPASAPRPGRSGTPHLVLAALARASRIRRAPICEVDHAPDRDRIRRRGRGGHGGRHQDTKTASTAGRRGAGVTPGRTASKTVVVTDGTAVPPADWPSPLASHYSSGAVTTVLHRSCVGPDERVVDHELDGFRPHGLNAQAYLAVNDWMTERLANETEGVGRRDPATPERVRGAEGRASWGPHGSRPRRVSRSGPPSLGQQASASGTQCAQGRFGGVEPPRSGGGVGCGRRRSGRLRQPADQGTLREGSPSHSPIKSAAAPGLGVADYCFVHRYRERHARRRSRCARSIHSSLNSRTTAMSSRAKGGRLP
jgi:hypothetical protein